MSKRIEEKADSLLFVLANKPWSAAFLCALAVALFVLGVIVGAAWAG